MATKLLTVELISSVIRAQRNQTRTCFFRTESLGSPTLLLLFFSCVRVFLYLVSTPGCPNTHFFCC
uniref:Uncharacterized protein n=1 Tax=Arundo donax TaxID=35708 RepID=A0A0A9BJV9_ARUDO